MSIRDAFLKSGTSVVDLTSKFKRKRQDTLPAAALSAATAAALSAPPAAPASVPAAPNELPEQWLTGPSISKPIQSKSPHIDDTERDDAYCAIDFWFRKPNLDSSKKPLLICGPPGSGKSHLIHYYGSVDVFDEDLMEDFIEMHGLKPRGPGLVDNIESLDRSEREILRKCFAGKHRRLVFTCDDLFQEPAKSFTKWCTVVKLDRPKRPFALKLLSSLAPDISKEILGQIIDACCSNDSINLTVLVNALHWLRKRSTSDLIDVHADMPMDVPKATASILYGKKVQCLGGSSDTSFLSLMLQLNVPQADCSLKALSKTLDQFSLLEIAEERHIMDSETHWNYLSMIASQGPKLNSKSKFWLTWPKSSKPAHQEHPRSALEAMKRYY